MERTLHRAEVDRAPDREGSALRARILIAIASTVASLAVAEVGAGALRGFAFPYLNLFEPSSRFGVVLRPSSACRVRSRTGRLTTVATNALGFRGQEWASAPSVAPVAGRVLLLGDSQILGYGVEYSDAIGSQLARALGPGWEVLPAATPTWGPIEEVRAIEDLGRLLRPEMIVFVANLSNDWFEARAPNTARSDARDGWLVRWDPRTPPPLEFPGRRWLLARSQLIFGARELWAFRGVRKDALVPAPEVAARLVREIESLRHGPAPFHTPIGPHLERANELSAAIGARLVAIALPIDLQVDPREWRKYRGVELELAPTEALLDDFLDDARSIGVPAMSLLAPLRSASPGVYQIDDDHLSPAGHAAAAAAVAPLLLTARGSPSSESRL